MPTSRHREYADDSPRDPAVRVDAAARRYAAALWALRDAETRVEECRKALLAEVEAGR